MTSPVDPPHEIDEETPLLSSQHKPTKTPLPWNQLSIVLVLQLAEPLTSNVIYPFAPQLVRDVGITHGDESKVGYYVGILQSLFFLTQACTVLYWSRISDSVGRKPIILFGLFGLSLSMYCFGLSRTYWGAVISRSLNGALNGNIGVIKSLVAEMTDSTNIASAYAFMPIAWSTGGTLGPIIGGSLSHPATRFPKTFGHNEFLKKYPYFLACAVPATFTAFVWVVTFVFLKETVRSPIEISRLFNFRKCKANTLPNIDASQELSAASLDPPDPIPDEEKPVGFRDLLTRRVVIAAANYSFLSLVDISIRAIQPLFFSTPIHLGGLGQDPAKIGTILSCYGILNGFMQVFFFAKVHDRYGSKFTFMSGIVAAVPVFASFPVINALARTQGLSTTVWMIVCFQVVISILLNFSYGSIFIYLSASPPNRASLGATNGLAQCFVSATRAIGPAAANSLFSLSIEKNLLGGFFVYYVLIALTLVAIFTANLLPTRVWGT